MTLISQVKFLELPALAVQNDLDNLEIGLDEEGFQASFAKLHTIARSAQDSELGSIEPKVYFLQQLAPLDRSAISASLAGEPEAAKILQSYGIPI